MNARIESRLGGFRWVESRITIHESRIAMGDPEDDEEEEEEEKEPEEDEDEEGNDGEEKEVPWQVADAVTRYG